MLLKDLKPGQRFRELVDLDVSAGETIDMVPVFQVCTMDKLCFQKIRGPEWIACIHPADACVTMRRASTQVEIVP